MTSGLREIYGRLWSRCRVKKICIRSTPTCRSLRIRSCCTASKGSSTPGAPGALVTEHLLSALEHRIVATFDVDRLIDYRSRRPVMTFVRDHWESYDPPELVLHLVHDQNRTPFLLLTGPEPDHEWERFLAAVLGLVERLDVRIAVGFHGIPMAVPHTRPLGLTAHATRPELVSGYKPFLNRVQVPGSAAALLELRLGESGHDAIGFAVHVPHYLAQAPYPAAAVTALEAVIATTGLALPVAPLRERAELADAEITRQVEGSDEIKSLVHALEEQYEAFAGASRARQSAGRRLRYPAHRRGTGGPVPAVPRPARPARRGSRGLGPRNPACAASGAPRGTVKHGTWRAVRAAFAVLLVTHDWLFWQRRRRPPRARAGRGRRALARPVPLRRPRRDHPRQGRRPCRCSPSGCKPASGIRSR